MPVTDNPVNNPELALFYVTMLQAMRTTNPQVAMDAILTGDIGELTVSGFSPSSGNNLAVYFGGNLSRKLLIIDGVQTSQQASAVMGGYGNILGVPTVVGNNTYIQDQANAIVGRYTLDYLFNADHVDIIGYSAGGAVALAILEIFRQREFRPKTKTSSFGSPRTGQTNIRDGLAGEAIARWMMDSDPIPLIPLRVQDAPILALMVPTGQLLNWSNFVHSAGGISIRPDGTFQASVGPLDATANPVTSVVNWYFSVEADPNNQHALSAYRAALTTAVRNASLPAAQTAPEGPAEIPNSTKRKEVTQNQERIATAIFTQAATQTAAPITTPEPALFHVKRSGRIWYVGLGDHGVFIAGPEKRARHIARAGNDFLRSIQKQACVDPTALVGQIDAFLKLAQDPSSGFAPLINTTPPE